LVYEAVRAQVRLNGFSTVAECAKMRLRASDFQKFPGGMPPDPPRKGRLRMRLPPSAALWASRKLLLKKVWKYY